MTLVEQFKSSMQPVEPIRLYHRKQCWSVYPNSKGHELAQYMSAEATKISIERVSRLLEVTPQEVVNMLAGALDFDFALLVETLKELRLAELSSVASLVSKEN